VCVGTVDVRYLIVTHLGQNSANRTPDKRPPIAWTFTFSRSLKTDKHLGRVSAPKINLRRVAFSCSKAYRAAWWVRVNQSKGQRAMQEPMQNMGTKGGSCRADAESRWTAGKVANSVFYIILVIASATPATAATVVIHDQTFTPGTWSTMIKGGTGVTGSSLSQGINGGVTGNSQTTTLSHSTTNFTFEVLDTKTDRPWYPAIDGKITSLTWELWYKRLVHDMYITAVQGTAVYAGSPFAASGVNETTWKKATGAQTPDNMLRRYGDGPLTLDFSPSAPPIYFGYLLIRGVFNPTASFENSFFDMQIQTIPFLPGDYNYDGTVDTQDYNVWRANFGASGTAADGNANGVVDAADYVLWRKLSSSGSGVSNSVPEPCVAMMIGVLFLAIVSYRRAVNE
jgi:hypothetical protein